MKITSSFILFFLCGLIISLFCFVGETKSESQSPSSQSIEGKQEAGNTTSQKETQQFVIRVKTKQKVDFSGTVNAIDPSSATLSIRNQGKTISFDMSRAILVGYESIGEIKRGDKISVGYTPYGLQIRKGIFAITHQDTTPRQQVTSQKVTPQETAPQKTVTRVDTAKPKKGAPIRMTDNNRYPKSFSNIDNNKDGKITPIELCVLVPDLTLQRFKEYDKNGDGCLNESEFNTAKRTK